MRESCKYGSVRGARGNSRPYRDPFLLHCICRLLALKSRGNAAARGPLTGVLRISRPGAGEHQIVAFDPELT